MGGGALNKVGNTYTLAPASRLSGSVVDPQGKPVADAIVRLSTITSKYFTDHIVIPDTLQEQFTGKSDVNGRWMIADMPAAGKATAWLDDPRFVKQNAQFTLGGADQPSLEASPGATLTGLARFVDGKPAKGIRVFCQGVENHNAWAEAQTDAYGRYRLFSLSTGPVNVMLKDAGGDWVAAAQENIQAVEGQEIAVGDLVLTAGAFIEGEVTVKETGKPIPEVTIGSYGPHRPRSSWYYYLVPHGRPRSLSPARCTGAELHLHCRRTS